MASFKIDKANWKSIPLESISFILIEAKEYLDYTILESDKITKRAHSIFLLLSAILSGLVAYTFEKIVFGGFERIVTINFCAILALVFILFQLGTIVFPRKIMTKGRIPKNLAIPKYLNNQNLNKNELHLSLIIQDVEIVQEKIDYNLIKNKKRQDRLKICMLSIAVLSILYLIAAFMTTF